MCSKILGGVGHSEIETAYTRDERGFICQGANSLAILGETSNQGSQRGSLGSGRVATECYPVGNSVYSPKTRLFISRSN